MYDGYLGDRATQARTTSNGLQRAISEQVQGAVGNCQGRKLHVNVCPAGAVMSNAWASISRPMESIMCGSIVSTQHCSLSPYYEGPQLPAFCPGIGLGFAPLFA